MGLVDNKNSFNSTCSDYFLCSGESLPHFRVGETQKARTHEDKLRWNTKGDERAGQEGSVGQVSVGERGGNENGREEKRGQEKGREHQRENERRDIDVGDAIRSHC